MLRALAVVLLRGGIGHTGGIAYRRLGLSAPAREIPPAL